MPEDRLSSASVLIVGIGGLGCPAAMQLASMGLGRLGLVDHDVVSLSNLQRQLLYRQQDVGRHKVVAARQALKRLNPACRVELHPIRIENSTTLCRIARGYTLLLDASDNFSCRFVVSDACRSLHLPHVSAAAESWQIQLSTFIDGPGRPCYRCLYDEQQSSDSGTCNSRGVMGSVPGLAGQLMAQEAWKLITGMGEPLSGRLLRINTRTLDCHSSPLPADPDCRCQALFS